MVDVKNTLYRVLRRWIEIGTPNGEIKSYLGDQIVGEIGRLCLTPDSIFPSDAAGTELNQPN